ncbi:hypothetical protein R1sor_000384 [Riccia sorocarpa]|uniref:Uncharacterized protein n=1 Tax=Riccia sorocarpa TaxID=122646 RepID=A0ABD3GVC0_9MARC
MLPGDAVLNRGEVYFLLPLPRKPQSATVAPVQPVENVKPAGTMKFVMTRQQLAMLLAEGNIKIATKEPKPEPPPRVHSVLHHPGMFVITSPSNVGAPSMETDSPRCVV